MRKIIILMLYDNFYDKGGYREQMRVRNKAVYFRKREGLKF